MVPEIARFRRNRRGSPAPPPFQLCGVDVVSAWKGGRQILFKPMVRSPKELGWPLAAHSCHRAVAQNGSTAVAEGRTGHRRLRQYNIATCLSVSGVAQNHVRLSPRNGKMLRNFILQDVSLRAPKILKIQNRQTIRSPSASYRQTKPYLSCTRWQREPCAC